LILPGIAFRKVKKLHRVIAALVTIGALLSLSGCGTSVPSAIGSYQATFVGTKASSTFPLVLAEDGHFVLALGPAGVPFRGSWSQTGSQVTLTGKAGSNKVVLMAQETGENLRQGSYESFGRFQSQRFTLPWSALRI
jgi:hypothetical protein